MQIEYIFMNPWAEGAHGEHAAGPALVDDPVVRDAPADHGESLHWHFAQCNQNDADVPR
jgi:hypothetical protein